MRRRQLIVPLCHCGRSVVTRTSWTDKNPARRFASCGNGLGESCDFFEWLDLEMCERAVNVIPDLLRRIRSIEVELENAAESMKILERKIAMYEVENQNFGGENRGSWPKFRRLCIVLGVFIFLFIWSSQFSEHCVLKSSEQLSLKALGGV